MGDAALPDPRATRDSRRVVAENLSIALVYWGVSAVNWLLFRSGGVLPMPIWPAAGLAIAVAYRFGWRAAPGLALGALLANRFPLGAPWPLACLIGIVNAAGPVLVATGVGRHPAGAALFRSFRGVIRFLGWGAIAMAAVTATGGVSARCLVGAIGLADVPLAWYRWWLAHASGAVLFGPLVISWFYPTPTRAGRPGEYTLAAAGAVALAAFIFVVPTGAPTPLLLGLPFALVIPLAWVAVRHTLLRTMVLFTGVVLIGMIGTVLGRSHPFGDRWPLAPFGLMAVSYSIVLLMLSGMSGEERDAEATAREGAEALRESETRLRTLSDNLPGGLVYQLVSGVHGEQRAFRYVSAGVEQLHGVTAAEVMADASVLYSQITDECRHRVAALEAEAHASLSPFNAEVCFRTPGGDTRWCLLSSAPRRLPDGRVIWDGVELDITDRKRAEAEREQLQAQLQQAQKMESVGRLAGGVAHDFNNMLSVIQGHAELGLEHLAEGQSVGADLEAIHGAAAHSADLTRQLLAFARQQTIAPRVLDLNVTVGEMIGMLRRLIGEDIDLTWVPATGLGAVRVDPSQIGQILTNLCVNARDAIAGVGRVTIETSNVTFDEAYCAGHAGAASGPMVMLAVSDTGCGMSPETRRQAFEPFFTTKALGRGTGLGLATVYGIVKQNGGFINVYSELGSGTTLKVYLPRVDPVAPSPPRGKAAHGPRGGPETILLVEDDPAIQQMTCAMLERKGYSVLVAGTPSSALQQAEQHAGVIDLLLTDVVMPEMNGRELAGRLAALHPNIRRLFMSGYTANVIAHHGVLDEGVHFLPKPFSMHDLAAKVREALDG